MQKKNLLADDAVVVCETDKEVTLPENIGHLSLSKEKVYGISKVTIYENIKSVYLRALLTRSQKAILISLNVPVSFLISFISVFLKMKLKILCSV